MKLSIRLSIVALIALIGGVLVTTPTLAQSAERSVRCTVSQVRLNTRITQIDTVRDAQARAYANLLSRIDRLVASAETNGYSVIDLMSARDAVQDKVDTFTAEAETFSKNLMTAKNLTCGESDGEYAAALSAARMSLVEVRTSALDVRVEFRESLIPALKDYAMWLNERATDATTEETN